MHRIRLRGPWDYEFDPQRGERREGRVQMPCSWIDLFGPVVGSVSFRRKFNSPSRLTDRERVWLAFEGVGGNGDISLNSETLISEIAGRQELRIDITPHLQRHNELRVRLASGPKPGRQTGLYDLVVLEIDPGPEIS